MALPRGQVSNWEAKDYVPRLQTGMQLGVWWSWRSPGLVAYEDLPSQKTLPQEAQWEGATPQEGAWE